MKQSFLALTAMCVVLGCQRGDDYLHHIDPRPPEVFHFNHKLKELQGESRVDILWVIDNSGSMRQHQDAVIQNSNLFIQEFVKQGSLDWKMGLVSTSEAEEPYVGFKAGEELDKKTPDPVKKFNEAVGRLGTGGDSTEKPFRCAQKALQENPSFLRSRAILALIMVTDAEEQSEIPVQGMLDFLSQTKGDTRLGVFYGALGPDDWGCNPASGGESRWNFVGSPYEALSQALKGKTYSLCSGAFGASLADLGKDLVKRIKAPRIPLTLRPKIETIRVTWRDQELRGGPRSDGGLWYYDFDLNAIVFHDLEFAPGENEEVVVHYEEAPS